MLKCKLLKIGAFLLAALGRKLQKNIELTISLLYDERMGPLNKRESVAAIMGAQTMTVIFLVTLNRPGPAEKIALGISILLFIAGCAAVYNMHKNLERIWVKLLKAYRMQKHDFHNHLQIIYSMIQLKKYDKVLDYINKTKKNDEVLNRICSMDDPWIICGLLEVFYLFRQFEIDVTLDVADKKNLRRVSDADLIKKANSLISKLKEVESPRRVRIILGASGVEMRPDSADDI